VHLEILGLPLTLGIMIRGTLPGEDEQSATQPRVVARLQAADLVAGNPGIVEVEIQELPGGSLEIQFPS
jgi:hypothetical protein